MAISVKKRFFERAAAFILVVLVYCMVLGIGFGGASTALTLIIQDSVDYQQSGSAVGANSLLRTLGQTIGISVFGNIFNSRIAETTAQPPAYWNGAVIGLKV